MCTIGAGRRRRRRRRKRRRRKRRRRKKGATLSSWFHIGFISLCGNGGRILSASLFRWIHPHQFSSHQISISSYPGFFEILFKSLIKILWWILWIFFWILWLIFRDSFRILGDSLEILLGFLENLFDWSFEILGDSLGILGDSLILWLTKRFLEILWIFFWILWLIFRDSLEIFWDSLGFPDSFWRIVSEIALIIDSIRDSRAGCSIPAGGGAQWIHSSWRTPQIRIWLTFRNIRFACLLWRRLIKSIWQIYKSEDAEWGWQDRSCPPPLKITRTPHHTSSWINWNTRDAHTHTHTHTHTLKKRKEMEGKTQKKKKTKKKKKMEKWLLGIILMFFFLKRQREVGGGRQAAPPLQLMELNRRQ